MFSNISESLVDYVEFGAGGWARFEVSVKVAQSVWARLANISMRKSNFTPDIIEFNRANLEDWASAVLKLAYLEEGSNAPNAGVYKNDANLTTLWWQGSWTEGREVEIDIDCEGETAFVRFKTGTEKASTFLDDIFSRALEEAGHLIPKRLAEKIRASLATAHGGYSQYETKDLVEAVCGHVRNGQLLREEKKVALKVVSEAMLQEEDRWGYDYMGPEEWLKRHEDAAAEVSKCWDQQRSGQVTRAACVRGPAIED